MFKFPGEDTCQEKQVTGIDSSSQQTFKTGFCCGKKQQLIISAKLLLTKTLKK